MFDFFKVGRFKPGHKNSAPDDSQPFQPASSVPGTSARHTATHRELIRVVLRDTLRMNGIPTDWISCEILRLPHDTDKSALLIQLVIRTWDEDLLRYAPAVQQQLLLGLARFDPASDHSKHLVNWKFSPHCGCPHATLPEPGFWAAKPPSSTTPKFDLPPAERAQENADFSPTIPGDLR